MRIKINEETEKKYGKICKECQKKDKKITKKQIQYSIGCPFREIDEEYCENIENIKKNRNGRNALQALRQ